jgi:hypothetical protein
MLLILCVNNLASFKAGAWRQFTMGWSALCIFIGPLMVGAEGFRLMYFHLFSLGTSVLLFLITFLICVWNVFVRSVFVFV